MSRPFVAGLLAAGVGAGVVSYHRWLRAQRVRASAESRVVETALGPVEHDRRGPEGGPTVLHLHGSTIGHNGWFLLRHLADAGYDLLTPDRPGYLGTPLVSDGSPAAQADVAAALLDALGIDEVAVVAISGGGTPALEFALRHPRRTRALVLIGAVTMRTPVSTEFRSTVVGRMLLSPRLQDLAYAVLHRTARTAPSVVLRDFARGETTYDPDTRRRYVRRLLDDPAQRRLFLDLVDAMVPARPRIAGVRNDIHVQETLDDLPIERIQAPTLVVHSRYDGDVPYGNAVNAHSRIPGAELMTVEQFGHVVWAGDPTVTREIEARIEGFLAEHTSRAPA